MTFHRAFDVTSNWRRGKSSSIQPLASMLIFTAYDQIREIDGITRILTRSAPRLPSVNSLTAIASVAIRRLRLKALPS